jgi:Ferric reductase like transmembrane component/FAD-binding domain/Ferric reductase NAD binding domain
LQSQIVLPALFGQRHSEPLSYSIGYVPQRTLSIWITIYVILNIIFSAVPFYSVQPSSWFTNRNQEIGAYVANRTGVLSFANMALAILFSSRNNPLAYFSSWTHSSFLAFHRWASRVAVLQAIVHSIVYTADYCYWREPGDFYTEAKLPYFWWGIIATTAMGLMAGLSAFPLRKYAYELFLVLHIALAILSLLGSWYHVQLRFTKSWGYEVWLYLAFAFWSYDRLVRLVKVVYYSRLGSSYGIASPVPNTNIVNLKVVPSQSWTGRPGSHTFLYFPSSGRFWENHPFTIADWGTGLEQPQTVSSTHSESSDTEEARGVHGKVGMRTDVAERASKTATCTKDGTFYVQCYFRVHMGTTSRLYRKLAIQGPSRVPIMTEGPYDSHAVSRQGLKSASKILCIAGGIGITWAAGFAKQFSAERLNGALPRAQSMMPCARRFALAWTVRERGLLEHVRQHNLPDLMAAGLDDGSLSYQFWLTGEDNNAKEGDKGSEANGEQSVTTTIGSRMDVSSVVASFMEEGETHAILFCGPGGLADAVRKSAVACSKKGYAMDLLEEKFAW